MSTAATSMILPLLILLLWLAVAAWTDLRERRVRNRWLLAGAGVALVLHGLALAGAVTPLGLAAWWAPLAGAAIGLLLMLPMYRMRAMGAADVKLMALVGAFIGPVAMPAAVLYTLVAGGALGMLYLRGGKGRLVVSNLRAMVPGGEPVHGRLTPLSRTAVRLPYAVAIAVGTLAALRWPLL